MSIARTTEITSTSSESFDDALSTGIERATKALANGNGAWTEGQEVSVEIGESTEYLVRLKVTFVLKDRERSNARGDDRTRNRRSRN